MVEFTCSIAANKQHLSESFILANMSSFSSVRLRLQVSESSLYQLSIPGAFKKMQNHPTLLCKSTAVYQYNDIHVDRLSKNEQIVMIMCNFFNSDIISFQ